MLWLGLATVVLLALFLVWAWRRKQALMAQFVQSRLLAHLTVGVSPARQRLRLGLLTLGVGCLFLALAQPQWGLAWEEARQRGLDLLVAIDTSRSMLAEDVPPNRLARAKLAALDLMKAAKSDRLGLIAFAGTAFLQCPLTLDDEAFRQSVDALGVGVIPSGGSSLTAAMRAAQDAYKNDSDNVKVLILFTDGEDHEAGALDAAQVAAKEGLRIFTIGVGTPAGELLPERDTKGATAWVKDDQGRVVRSKLNEGLLREVAAATQGFYLPLRGVNTIEALYQRGLAPLPKTDIASKRLRRFHERFQWPLGLALVLVVIELFVPERRPVARSAEILQASNPELRRAVALLLALAMPWAAAASPAQARRDYESGRYADALREYERLQKRRPGDDRLRFNVGAAAYKSDNLEQAAEHFGSVLRSTDLGLQQRAYYNLGNTLFQSGEHAGEPPKKIEAWENAIKSFESALKLDPKDQDARHNLEFVRQRLEALKKQLPKQSKPSDSPNKKEQDHDQEEKQEKQNPAEQQQDQQQQEQQQQEQQQQQQQPQPKQDAGEAKHQAPDQAGQQPDSQRPEPEPGDQGRDQDRAGKGSQDKDRSEPAEDSVAQASQDSSGETNSQAQAQAAVTPGEMNLQQALQLLEAQKNNEKMLLYAPRQESRSTARTFKDW
jgi:Ca-activated chloride channel family protein